MSGRLRIDALIVRRAGTIPRGKPTSSFFTNQKSTNEWNTLKDSQDRYSEPSYYTGANSNTFRIPDNRNTFAVRNPKPARESSYRAPVSFEASRERFDDQTV